MNSVVLIGNLTKDVEIIETETYVLAKGTIAVNDRVKRNDEWLDEPSFIDFLWFAKHATKLAPYLVKGKKVAIAGKLKQDRWQTEAGENRSKVQVLVRQLDLLTPPQQQPQQEQEAETETWSDEEIF